MIAQGGTQSLGLYDFKRQLDAFGGVDYFRESLAGGYLPNARVMLNDGTIVQNVSGENNTNNPNINIAGWGKEKTVNVIDSVDDLGGVKNPKNGDVVFVNGLQGGWFTYNTIDKGNLNNVTVWDGWRRNRSEYLLATDAGCQEGDFENTVLLNNLIKVASDEGIQNIVLNGLFEVGKLEKGITTTPFGDENAWWLLKCRSNVTIRGRSWKDGIRLKGGLVASNKDEPNTKGYMIFGDYNQSNVENFTMKNFSIDNNGQNNLMPEVVGFGAQALCPNVWFQRGTNIRVENIHFIDNPGHQTIVLDSGVNGAYVENCQFTDNGKGLVNNIHIVDHSTVYVRATDFWVTDNNFTFTTLKPDLSTALEIHGVNGHVYGNTTTGYPFSLIRASFFGQNSKNVKVYNNTFNDVTYGLNLDGADNSPLYVDVYNNTFNFRAEKPVDGKANVAIGHTATNGFNGVTPSSTHSIVINVYNNTFNQPSPTGGWSIYNEFDNCIWDGGKCTEVNMIGNTFNGFKGGYRINYANNRAKYNFNDTLNNCGSNSTPVLSSVVIQNIDSAWGSQIPSLINSSKMSNCLYNSLVYFANSIPPKYAEFSNDSDTWVLPYEGESPDNSDVVLFEYSVSKVDADKILYAQGINVAGKISLPNDQYFYKQNGYIGRWNMHRRLGTIPSSPRFFGDIKGDKVDILAPNSGDYANFVCTVSGVDVNTIGTWKGYGMVQA